MKNIIIVLSLLSSLSAISQTISFNEMVALLSKDWEQAENQIEKKGFQYHDSSDDSKWKKISYFDDKVKELLRIHIIHNAGFSILDGKVFIVELNTFNKERYTTLKNSAIANGFKVESSEIEDNIKTVNYRKGILNLKIRTEKRNNYGSSSVTVYSFGLDMG